MKPLLLLLSVLLILGCAKPQSNSSQDKSDVLNDFLDSKSKWEAAKGSILSYEIVYSGCGMTECSQTIVLFDSQNNSVISCNEKVRDFESSDFVLRDCMDQTYYLKTVEDYFKEFGSIMLSGQIQNYKFDPIYGVPILAVGTTVDDLQDSGAPGFEFKFTAH